MVATLTHRYAYIKVLICLRKLGRYEVDDTSSELSYVGESTIRELFEKYFVTNFSNEFYREYVNVPSGNKLKEVTGVVNSEFS